jgi:hypothetical protein
MKCEAVDNKYGLKTFYDIASKVYRGNKNYRVTERSIEHLLIRGPSAFHRHSEVLPYIIRDGNDITGRFALIRDKNLHDYLQVSFFEALPEQGNLLDLIRREARKRFPDLKKMVVGLNGHLNYGAGFLLNRFDEPPLFGLPYTMPYYPSYFSGLNQRRMFSFRFRMEECIRWAESYGPPKKMNGLEVRFMDKKQLTRESSIYTFLNNRAFASHPFWAAREDKEDLELFYPFRFLLQNENLIVAEFNGKPVGFFLWYPDFNELVTSQRDLNFCDVLKFRAGKRIKVFRFTEIGVLPELQKSPVGFSLLMKSIPVFKRCGFEYCEGGFIFEENKSSIALVTRMIYRSSGIKPLPYRSYAVYDGKL